MSMSKRTAKKNGYKYSISIYMNTGRCNTKFYKTYNGVLREYNYFKQLFENNPKQGYAHIHDLSNGKLLNSTIIDLKVGKTLLNSVLNYFNNDNNNDIDNEELDYKYGEHLIQGVDYE